MNPRLEIKEPFTLVGINRQMSLAANTTGQLWRMFMTTRPDLAAGTDLYSLQVYPAGFDFSPPRPESMFTKWAGAPDSAYRKVPADFEPLFVEGGLYAVFDYKGLNTDPAIFEFIFGSWIPESDYLVDARPHFEVLGKNYRNNDPLSEEEIWIPVKKKQGK